MEKIAQARMALKKHYYYYYSGNFTSVRVSRNYVGKVLINDDSSGAWWTKIRCTCSWGGEVVAPLSPTHVLRGEERERECDSLVKIALPSGGSRSSRRTRSVGRNPE